MYSFASVEHHQHKATRKAIRGNIISGGWHVLPVDDNQCEVTMISICDPCRYIPAMLATMASDASGKTMAMLRKKVMAQQAEGSTNVDTRLDASRAKDGQHHMPVGAA